LQLLRALEEHRLAAPLQVQEQEQKQEQRQEQGQEQGQVQGQELQDQA